MQTEMTTSSVVPTPQSADAANDISIIGGPLEGSVATVPASAAEARTDAADATEEPTLPFSTLYRYADSTDWFMFGAACFVAAAGGCVCTNSY